MLKGRLLLGYSSKTECLLKPFRAQYQFESLFKSITQKGNAHLGLGQFGEAKECYESLRTLADNSVADQYLKKLDEVQERDIHLFSYDTFFYHFTIYNIDLNK